MNITPLDFAGFVTALLVIVGAVFFLGGRAWERYGHLAPVTPPPAPDRETAVMLDWVHEVAAPPALPPVPAAALVPLPPPRPAPPCPALYAPTAPSRRGGWSGTPPPPPTRL